MRVIDGVDARETIRAKSSKILVLTHPPQTGPDIKNLCSNVVRSSIFLVSFHRIITTDTTMKFQDKWR